MAPRERTRDAEKLGEVRDKTASAFRACAFKERRAVSAAAQASTAPMAAQGPLMRVSGVEMRFGGIVALAGVSFDVNRREICGLIGPNGSG